MGEARRRQQSSPGSPGEALRRVRTDDLWTGAGGVALMGVCMMLPMVGPAGALTPQYGKNLVAFSLAALLSAMLSGAGAVLKLRACRRGEGSFPGLSIGLFVTGLLLLIALPLGILRQ